MTTDVELLRQYVNAASEDAFTELVQRHLPLVYSAALRQVDGDAELAKDIAQTVFLALARKARSLLGRELLVGWLYASTHFAAATALRGQRRRQHRERVALSMQEAPPSSAPAPDRSELAAVLDHIMADLAPGERNALLLRFFQNKEFKEVGTALGITEDAARMRVSRAVEKLQALLTARGTTVSAAVLGTFLATETISAVPAGLAATISTAALAGSVAGGSTLTLLKLATMTKLKLTLLTAVVVAGAATPVVLHQQARLQALHQENESLRVQLAQQQEPTANPPAQPAASPYAAGETVSPAEVERLRSQEAELMRARNQLRQLHEQVGRAATPPALAPASPPAMTQPASATTAPPSTNAPIAAFPPLLQQVLATNYSQVLDHLKSATNEFGRYLVLSRAAKFAYLFGNTNEAHAYATEALNLDQGFQNQPWRSGDALHDANMTLGRLALQEGRLDEAKQYLLAAGQTPGSSSLNSFGPNMGLAQDLLQAGERDTVLQYLELCSRFWGSGHQSQLSNWTAQVQAGTIPDFGPNLMY